MNKYNEISDEQGLMMAEILTLTEKQKQTISFTYTESETDYPEKILNLVCEINGSWRIFDFAELRIENVYSRFKKLMMNERAGIDVNGLLAHHFWIANKTLSVRCKNLDEGPINLWKKITRMENVNPSKSQIWKWYQDFCEFPYILIKEEEVGGNKWYESFIYSPERHSFVRLSLSEHDNCYKDYAQKYYKNELPPHKE